VERITKREVNSSFEEKTFWKLNLFTEFQAAQDEYLRCGNVIWLHHSEANSILIAQHKSKGVNKYNFSSLDIETWLSHDNLIISTQNNKEAEGFDDYSGNTYGMF
jgi:inositol 1,4,5-triphosphate receptor type 1